MNKSEIVEKGGLDKLIKLSGRFADDPSVLLEVRICNICLGSQCKITLRLKHPAPSIELFFLGTAISL